MSYLEIQNQFLPAHCAIACSSLDPAISHNRAIYSNSEAQRHSYFGNISLLSQGTVSLNYYFSQMQTLLNTNGKPGRDR